MEKEQNRFSMILFSSNGFTLPELLISIVVALVVTGFTYATYIAQQKSFIAQDQVTEMQSTSMISIGLLTKDLKEAGFGVPNPYISNSIQNVPNVITHCDGNIVNCDPPDAPENNYGTADVITLLAGYRQVARVTTPASVGDDQITVDNVDNLTDSNGDKSHINIMGLQHKQIASINGNTLTLAGGGLSKNVLVDTPVYLIESVSYQITPDPNDPNKPLLRKTDNVGMPNLTYTIADNIEDLQMRFIDDNGDNNNDRVQIHILSKTRRGDPNFKDQGRNLTYDGVNNVWNPTGQPDNIRRRLLTLPVALRNNS